MEKKTILRSLKGNPLSNWAIKTTTTEDLLFVYYTIDRRSWSVTPMSFETDMHYAETRSKITWELKRRGL